MAAAEPHDIVLEFLRRFDQRQARFEDLLRELRSSQIATRDEIHATRGDILRQEKAIAALEVDIDRIKVRLDLSDA
jgi:hypothetical protein